MTHSDSPLRPAPPAPATAPVQDTSGALPLDRSVAGEEDPGASLDEFTHVPPPAPGVAAAASPAPRKAGSKAR